MGREGSEGCCCPVLLCCPAIPQKLEDIQTHPSGHGCFHAFAWEGGSGSTGDSPWYGCISCPIIWLWPHTPCRSDHGVRKTRYEIERGGTRTMQELCAYSFCWDDRDRRRSEGKGGEHRHHGFKRATTDAWWPAPSLSISSAILIPSHHPSSCQSPSTPSHLAVSAFPLASLAPWVPGSLARPPSSRWTAPPPDLAIHTGVLKYRQDRVHTVCKVRTYSTSRPSPSGCQ